VLQAANLKSPNGIWGAVLLSVSRHGSIDWNATSAHVSALCESSVNGIYTNGTAGEFHNQTDEEYLQLTELVAGIAKDNQKSFQLGVSHSNPRVALQRLQSAIKLLPDGVQFTLPDWWTLSSNELITFVEQLQVNAGNIPLILYNPPHAKHQLSLADIHTLVQRIPNLVGVKIAAGDAAWYATNQQYLKVLSVFVPGHSVAFGRPLGASGSYSNVACLSPDGAVMHWNLIQSDLDAAIELESRINRFMQTHLLTLAAQRGLSNGALDKLMAAAGGWSPLTEKLLWPYHSASKLDVSRVAAAAQNELPELF